MKNLRDEDFNPNIGRYLIIFSKSPRTIKVTYSDRKH